MMLHGRSGLLRAVADISWNAGTGYSRDKTERGFLRAELEMMSARAQAHTHTHTHMYVSFWIFFTFV